MRIDHKIFFELLRCIGVEYNRKVGNRVVTDEKWLDRKIKIKSTLFPTRSVFAFFVQLHSLHSYTF